MATKNQTILKKNPRIPRKKGQPAGSKKHSDLYTDENPRGTIHGLKFATVQDARDSVKKIENSGKKHAHKIQGAIAMEQRAKEMGKTAEAAVYRAYIEKMKKITKQRQMQKEDFEPVNQGKLSELIFQEVVIMEKIMICIICIYLCLVQCSKEYFQKKLEEHSFTLPVQMVLKICMTYKIQRSLYLRLQI